MSRPLRSGRKKLLVAKIGVATITYTVLASPIACNLPAPPPPEPTDAAQGVPSDSTPVAAPSASPEK